MKTNQTGASLLELTIALGVILTITGAIAGGFAANRANARFDASRTELLTVASAASQIARNGNLAGINERFIAESRLVPETMVRGNGATTRLTHSMGGQFLISPETIPGVPGATGVRIVMSGLSAGRCEDAAVTFAERFDVVTVGSTAVKNRLLTNPTVPDRNVIEGACAANPEVHFFLIP